MRLGMEIRYEGGFKEAASQLRDLERAGLDIIWVPEAYSFDAVTQMGYLAAVTDRVQIASSILNVYSRTATTIAMTMAGLDYLTDGRAICGLGASGPQVIEGFHGIPHDKPLTRVREYIEVCRMLWRREKVELNGQAVSIPLPKGQGTGLGKALKLINQPVRARIPIWWAALMGKSVATAAEVADGWLPTFFMPERAERVWGDALKQGLARRSPELGRLEIAAGGATAIGDNLPVDELRDTARSEIALYVGGMGARGKNYYNTVAQQYGFVAEAATIQDLYLDGKKDEAAAKVPSVWLEQTSLIGPRGYVAERIAAYKEAGVTVLNIDPVAGDPVKTVEQMRELVD